MSALSPVLTVIAIVLMVIAFGGMMMDSNNRYPGPMIGVALALMLLAWMITPAEARDDGRYAGSPLKGWFDQLKSGKGLCCSDSDGFAVQDPDWDSKDGHYRVRLGGKWIDVPDEAVIREPNRAGMTMVWPINAYEGTTIRCFMPGSMT
jgi:hypothetical protein